MSSVGMSFSMRDFLTGWRNCELTGTVRHFHWASCTSVRRWTGTLMLPRFVLSHFTDRRYFLRWSKRTSRWSSSISGRWHASNQSSFRNIIRKFIFRHIRLSILNNWTIIASKFSNSYLLRKTDWFIGSLFISIIVLMNASSVYSISSLLHSWKLTPFRWWLILSSTLVRGTFNSRLRVASDHLRRLNSSVNYSWFGSQFLYRLSESG